MKKEQEKMQEEGIKLQMKECSEGFIGSILLTAYLYFCLYMTEGEELCYSVDSRKKVT
jgi:hypothetical protein